MNLNKLITAIVGFGIISNAAAQTNSLTPFRPSVSEMKARFARAAERDSLLRESVFKTWISPQWVNGSSCWYSNRLPDGQSEYIWVEPGTKTMRKTLFTSSQISQALKQAGDTSLKDFFIRDMHVAPAAKYAIFKKDSMLWKLNMADMSVEKTDHFPEDTTTYPGLHHPRGRWARMRSDRTSPDRHWRAFIRDYNIFIAPADGGDAVPYTTDGTKALPYGDLSWSPDAAYLVGYKIKPVEDASVHYILTSQPGTFRGELKSHRYKQPGDPFPEYEMFIVHREDSSVKKVNTEIIDFFGAPALHWIKGAPGKFLFEKVDRGHQRFRIIEVDAASSNTRNIIDEQTKTFIYEQRIFTYYMPDSGEIIWISEKDGWRHIYLVDGKEGKIKNQITKGNWVVRSIDSVDVKKKEIWFQASGRNPEEDPYNMHYYRTDFSGKKLIELTPAPGNHRLVFSPDKKFFTDTYSTVNTPPVSIFGRTSDGKKLTDLETADISRYEGYKFILPETFVAKGRDGLTDIYGVVYRPSDFDSTKKYPIIENIYAGPQDAFVPKSFTPAGEMQSIAELGFIVVQIDGMGTANRSKAFHDVCWQNLADAGFPDRIAWMRALAQKHPQADTTRVGLYGTSAGGQNAMGGLLFHPDWYKAAVSACGCHDNRVDKQWWNEQWMGYPVGKHYEEQSNVTNAHKLQGKLLLIVGEADTNVPPESTYRVVDALIKANKPFDFLPIPGMGHSDGGPYGRAKKRDFFVKHLLGVERDFEF